MAIISAKSYRVYQHSQYNVKSQQAGAADAQSSHTFSKQELLSNFPLFLFYRFEAPLFYFHGSEGFNIHTREAEWGSFLMRMDYLCLIILKSKRPYNAFLIQGKNAVVALLKYYMKLSKEEHPQ